MSSSQVPFLPGSFSIPFSSGTQPVIAAINSSLLMLVRTLYQTPAVVYGVSSRPVLKLAHFRQLSVHRQRSSVPPTILIVKSLAAKLTHELETICLRLNALS